MFIRKTDRGDAPMEFGRAVRDVQRTPQTDPGATLSNPARDSVDAALRPTAQVTVGRQTGIATSPLSVDPANVGRSIETPKQFLTARQINFLHRRLINWFFRR